MIGKFADDKDARHRAEILRTVLVSYAALVQTATLLVVLLTR